MKPRIESDTNSIEKDIVPCSPDAKMKRRRADREKKIVNNPNMLLNYQSNTESEASNNEESDSSGCLKLNMCFNREDESDYNPDDSTPKVRRGFSPFESAYKIDTAKGSMKKYIEEEMFRFDRNFDFNTKKMRKENLNTKTASFDVILKTITDWAQQAKMENEIPIMALVYIERLMKKTGILINENNWERIVLITL